MSDQSDGRSGFDFLFGRWSVLNRQLVATPEGRHRWWEFNTACFARPILGGLGNVDEYHFPGDGSHAGWDASTLRVYDTKDDLWRIYWSSTAYPGPLAEPMVGTFDEGVGIFYGQDVTDDHTDDVRFLWTHDGRRTAMWEQSILRPGPVWETNWIMQFTRISEA